MASQRAASLVLLSGVVGVAAQDMPECFSAGSVAGAVLGTLVVTLALVSLGYALYRMYWRNRRGKHLVLVTDPERADLGDQYAFDNPCFRDGTPIGKGGYEKEPVKSDNKSRWSAWSPLGALVGSRSNEKRRALDDSFAGEPQVNVVSLRSHDFTGLGFSICGNMRDGIFVKDVLHRGPASESGRITPGDRIDSIRISFRHMVFEDALTILSYASPYEVQLEVENPSPSSRPSTLLRTKRASLEPADRICHPFYRSQSIADLAQIGTASLKRVQDIGGLKSPRRVKSEAWDESRAGEYPTLKLSPLPTKERVNLEKTASPSNPTSVTIVKPERTKRPSPKPDSPPARNEGDVNKDVKTDAVGKHQKFGVRVLPDPKALAARLKSTSEEVKLRSDASKKQTADKPPQNNVNLADNTNVKQSNITESEHRENEQNSMAEQIKTVPQPSKNVHVSSNVFTGQPGGSVDVSDSSKSHGRLLPKTLFYDERPIDVGPVEEEENRRKSASYEPKNKDEDSTKKPVNVEGTSVTDGHSNVKLLLTKGLQNLKEKLHHHDRKKISTTPEPQLDVEVNPNPSPSKKKPGKEKPRKSSSSDSDGTPEKVEVKMRVTAQTKILHNEDKDKERKTDLKSEGERHPNEGQIPTEIPEEVRRAAVAARSNRKSCSNLMPDTNVVSLVKDTHEVASDVPLPEQPDTQILSVSPPDASTIKPRVHLQDSWSEDSSGDANDGDGVDRAPKRSNKRKAPLPPPEEGDIIRTSQDTLVKGATTDAVKSTSLEVNGVNDDLQHRNDVANNVVNSKTKSGSIAPLVVKSNEVQVMGVHSSSDSHPTFTEMARQQNNPPVHNEITNIIVESNSSSEHKTLKEPINAMENITVDVLPPSSKKADNSESDSDLERQEMDTSHHRNKKGGTTIELNSSHITIHHSPSADTVTLELEGDNTRKAASLGDLSRFDSEQPMSVLERAVSLDLADSGTPHSCKKRKAPLPPPGEDYMNTMQDNEDEASYRKEPRLDNALDTFQRRRLKKSSDWGTMEDAVQQSSPPASRKSLNLDSDTDAAVGNTDLSQSVELGEGGNKENGVKSELNNMDSTPEDVTKSYAALDSVTLTSFPKASARTLDSKGQPHSFANSTSEPGDLIHMQVMSSHSKKNGQDTEVDAELVANGGVESHSPQRTVLRITPEPISNMEAVSSSRVTFAPTSSSSGPSSLSTDEMSRALTPEEDLEIAGSRLLTFIQGFKEETRSLVKNPDTSVDSTPIISQSIEHHTIVSSTPLPNREHHKQHIETIQFPQVTSTDGGVQNIQVVSSSTHSSSSPTDLKNISRINRNLLATSGFESTISSKSDDSFNDTEGSIVVTSATDPYVTAGSVVDSTTTYISNSDDEDSTLGHDLPPELPTSPVPVMASTYTPSSSMTYITEIQVSTITPKKPLASRTVEHNGSLQTETPTRKRDSSISSDSIGSGGEDKDAEIIVSAEMKPHEENNSQQHNNITVTSIRSAAMGNIDKSKIPTRMGSDGILTTFQSSPNVGIFERSQIPMRTGTEGLMTTFQNSTTNLKNVDSSQIPVRVGSEGVLTTFKSNVNVGSGERSHIPMRITTNMHEGSSTVNNGPSLGEKKNKAVRPPVPPRKSDTAVSSVVTVEIPSPNRSADNIHNKFVSSGSSSPYGIYDSTSNAHNSGGSKKFISFSSLTPRSVSGDISGRNSSFEQWVFLEGDRAHTSNGNQHNGQETTVEDNPHSTVVTLPATLAGRPPSVTHILLDAKQSSGSRGNQ